MVGQKEEVPTTVEVRRVTSPVFRNLSRTEEKTECGFDNLLNG